MRETEAKPVISPEEIQAAKEQWIRNSLSFNEGFLSFDDIMKISRDEIFSISGRDLSNYAIRRIKNVVAFANDIEEKALTNPARLLDGADGKTSMALHVTNPGTRAFVEKLYGVKFPKTIKGTAEVLRQLCTEKQYSEHIEAERKAMEDANRDVCQCFLKDVVSVHGASIKDFLLVIESLELKLNPKTAMNWRDLYKSVKLEIENPAAEKVQIKASITLASTYESRPRSAKTVIDTLFNVVAELLKKYPDFETLTYLRKRHLGIAD